MRRLVALTLGVVVAGGLLAAGMQLAGIDERRLWEIKRDLFGPEAVGIFQDDERLGWRHIPNAEGREREVPDFDVVYHIDEFGNRVTPGAPPVGAPALLFLGGSFTFGHGVEDGETYPARLQARWPELRVVNAATQGWGTAQALLSLDEQLARERNVVGVVYGFITQHAVRNHLRREWLVAVHEMRGRRNPYFELDGDELVFAGLAGPELGREADAEQLLLELHMTTTLVRALAKRCKEVGVPFVVVYLPDGTQGPLAPLLDDAVGRDRVIDLRTRLDYASLHFAHDSHLRPDAQASVAEVLAPILARRLALQVDEAQPGP